MGCDIHIAIQRQESDGRWREVPYQDLWNFDGAPKAVPGFPVAPEGWRNRNYDLFGILADVRNGTGFAGIVMGDGWPSIAPNRGFADGFSEALPDPSCPEDGPRYMGDHSFTHVTFDELKAFPWDATKTTLYGVVEAEKYESLAGTGKAPTSYSGGISGPGIKTYSPNQYREAKANGGLAVHPYVRMSWQETAREATNDWPGKVLPWLESISDGHQLRLVIGFDS